MIRFTHMMVIGALIGSAGYAYSTKYETLVHAEQVAKLKTKAQKEREMIAVLKAEWHLLNRPERLQAAAERHLDVQPLGILQLARLSDLPERPPRADEIGRKLEALGLLEPTATPKDPRAGDARTPTARLPAR